MVIKLDIGLDIVEINRIRELYKKDKFKNRIFTRDEISYIDSRKKWDETAAGIFAAKEAFLKSINEGFGKIYFKDIKIDYNIKGSPHILYKNKKYNISITHDKKYALAVVLNKENIDNIEIPENFIRYFKDRNKNSHKGIYGKIGIIGGSIGMCGSVYMSALAALKTGSGLVYNLVPKSISNIMQIKSIENIIIPIEDYNGCFCINSIKQILKTVTNYDAIAIGPGMGDFLDGNMFINELINNYNKNIIIDADGINAISKNPDILENNNKNIVLTPHLKEMSRLSGYTITEIEKNRVDISKEIARKYNIILVLKGHNTIVTDGNTVYANNTGNSGMATAGSGDVLTGIIVSLLGQGIDIYDAAKLGVYLHGFAGDIAKEKIGEDGLIATDIINSIPEVNKKIKEYIKWININPI